MNAFVSFLCRFDFFNLFFSHLCYAEQAEVHYAHEAGYLERDSDNLPLSWWLWASFMADRTSSRYYFEQQKANVRRAIAGWCFLLMLRLTDPLWVIESVEEFAETYKDAE